MFDINRVINIQIDDAYLRGRYEAQREVMDLLGKHNNTNSNNYIEFVQELIELCCVKG